MLMTKGVLWWPYFAVSNKWAGFDKQTGRIFSGIQINEQDLIRATRVENGHFLYWNGSEQGRTLINEKAPIRESRLEKSGKKSGLSSMLA